MKKTKGFIGVDFDGTLSSYDKYEGPTKTGDPIMPMVDRVKRWLKAGKNVSIFTARVAPAHTITEIAQAESAIEEWCEKHIGQKLPITAIKSPHMYELWDDKAVGVEKNTGKIK